VPEIKQIAKRSLPQPVWTMLRLARIWSSVRFYRERKVDHVFGGFPLSVWLTDPLAQGWYDHDWAELPEITLLRTGRLKQGARVFDLGAHQCIVAMMLSLTVGVEGQVVALEANPHNAEIGERNRVLNNIAQLKVLHGAAAKDSGTVDFGKGLNGTVASGVRDWGQQRVRAYSVDELAREYGRPDVLFIDVEGFECEVLKGAGETLRERPDAFIEVHTGCGLERFGGSREEIMSTFPGDRYELFVAEGDTPRFSPVKDARALPTTRFFLVALGRDKRRSIK
jgi:FkbM family methyltransferase